MALGHITAAPCLTSERLGRGLQRPGSEAQAEAGEVGIARAISIFQVVQVDEDLQVPTTLS